jgi:hypothetical protein
MARRPKVGTSRLRDPSNLSGAFSSRVFIGGSYKVVAASSGLPPRTLLEELRKVVASEGLHPVIADEYEVIDPHLNIRHDAIYLLHACRLAAFELSEFSGALMEIERSADFGTHCLILHYSPSGNPLELSWMLSSFRSTDREFDCMAILELPMPRIRHTIGCWRC